MRIYEFLTKDKKSIGESFTSIKRVKKDGLPEGTIYFREKRCKANVLLAIVEKVCQILWFSILVLAVGYLVVLVPLSKAESLMEVFKISNQIELIFTQGAMAVCLTAILYFSMLIIVYLRERRKTLKNKGN